MTLTFDLNIKIIFSPWIWVWQNVFALWHRHSKFWHIGVSPWDNMLCTFLTLVWPWPLTYMRVAGGILSEFYSQFLSCFILTLLNSIFFNFYCRFITFINWIRLSISLIRMYWFNDSLLFSDQCTTELSAVTETLASCQVSHHIHGLPLLLLPDGHGSSGCGGHHVRHSPTNIVLW